MPRKHTMTIDERRKYLSIMQLRYVRAARPERSHLLDEMVTVLALDRKTITRLLSGDLERHARQTQRGPTYGRAVTDAVCLVAESLDYICAERLTPNLRSTALRLAAHGELLVSSELLDQLDHISIATVHRLLQKSVPDDWRLPRPAPAHPNSLTRAIPMTRIPWDEGDPGHFEADLVHHSGPSSNGTYTYTLQLVDVATGWSERTALLGRSYARMQDAFGRIQTRLPFPIVELHPDNGSEFFNAYLQAYWAEKLATMLLTRSRPFHKNDNRFVEQKNSSLVRAYLGEQRFDTITQTLAINRLYDKMWVYYNLFQPVMHLTEKAFVALPDGGSRLKRRYDNARPPFDRLCATTAISASHREDLERLRDRTNPRRLRQEIYSLLDEILAMPCAEQADRAPTT